VRRSSVIVWSLITLLLVGVSVVFYSKYKKYENDYTQLTAAEEQTRQRYENAVSEIAAIQDSLNAIVLGDEAGKLMPAQLQTEGGTPQTHRDAILERIAMLKAGLERTKDRIQELDSRLKKSGIRIAGMERMIVGLKKTVAEKEQQIALLDGQVDALETQVAGLSADVEVKTMEAETKQRELATIYYAMGTKKELTNSGVVESKGGVLGMGKTLKPTGQVNETIFTALDTDHENVIRIPAENAKVLSAQPVTSYTLQPVSKELVELRILDPKEFRKVRHLVILMT
jgi:uncharacterized coiled-coil protein SlyX